MDPTYLRRNLLKLGTFFEPRYRGTVSVPCSNHLANKPKCRRTSSISPRALSARQAPHMADSIRGDGLLRADRALQELLENPERLQRARARFSESPPSYRSRLSGTTTMSQSPDPPSEAQQRREDREEKRFQLELKYRASFPYNQFEAQYRQELDRFKGRDDRTYDCPPGVNDIYEHADQNVKERWVDQGIWKDEWNSEYRPGGRWKHEEPPELESGQRPKSKVVPGLFGAPVERTPALPVKTSEEVQREKRDREASRPYYQFIYQVSKERERIQKEMTRPIPPRSSRPQHPYPLGQPAIRDGSVQLWPIETDDQQEGSPGDETTVTIPPNINTIAYERVKNSWIKWQIWDTKWGVLPGMSWIHEKPLEEFIREELGDDLDPGEADGIDANRSEQAEPLGRDMFLPVVQQQSGSVGGMTYAPDTNGDGTGGIVRPPGVVEPDQPAESSQKPESRGLNVSAPDVPQIKSPPPAGNDAGNSPLASSPLDGVAGRSQPASSTPRRTQPRRRTAQSAQTQPANAKPSALQPVRPAKVSKVRKPRRPALSGRPEPDEAPDDAGQPTVTDTPPRRSRRLQAAQDNKPTKADAAPDQRNGVRRSGRRTSTGAPESAAAKPKGVTKGRPRSTRRKAG